MQMSIFRVLNKYCFAHPDFASRIFEELLWNTCQNLRQRKLNGGVGTEIAAGNVLQTLANIFELIASIVNDQPAHPVELVLMNFSQMKRNRNFYRIAGIRNLFVSPLHVRIGTFFDNDAIEQN